jgi:hypothetical protein
VWWARKAEDANSSGYHSSEPVHDEENIESDEEDHGQHATEPRTGTSVPLPTVTDATQASVEQLSTLAVSTKDDEPVAELPSVPAAEPKGDEEVKTENTAIPAPASKSEEPTASTSKDASSSPIL